MRSRASLSVVSLLLLIPHRVVEIEDTLTECGAARVDPDLGASQTRLSPRGLIGVLARIGTGADHQQGRKRAKQGNAGHCNLQSKGCIWLSWLCFNGKRRLPH